MPHPIGTQTDLLVSWSRRSLCVALAVVLLLEAAAIVLTGFPGSAAAALASNLMKLLPVIIVIAILAVRSSAKRLNVDPVALIAGVSTFSGAAIVLASLLYYDR